MGSGLTGKQIGIAIALAVGLGIVGTVVGARIGALWLGYSGSVVAVLYLVFGYIKAHGEEELQRSGGAGSKRSGGSGSRSRSGRRND